MKVFAKAALIAILVATPVFSGAPSSKPAVRIDSGLPSGVTLIDWKDTAKDKGKKVIKFAAKSAKKTLPVRVGAALLVPKTACAPANEEDIKNC